MAQAKRKKKFFDVNIPLIGKTTQLLAYDEEEIIGRYIKYDLTRMLKGKGIEARFKTMETKEGVQAIPNRIRLLPFFLRRAVRKGTNYVEDSFSVECLDATLRIKPFLVTRRKVSRAVRKTLRNQAKKDLEDYLKTMTAQDIFEEALRNRIQKPLSLRLKKIYPLSLCELRVIAIEKEKENFPLDQVPKKEKEEEEPKKVTKKTTKKVAEDKDEKKEEVKDEEEKKEKEEPKEKKEDSPKKKTTKKTTKKE